MLKRERFSSGPRGESERVSRAKGRREGRRTVCSLRYSSFEKRHLLVRQALTRSEDHDVLHERALRVGRLPRWEKGVLKVLDAGSLVALEMRREELGDGCNAERGQLSYSWTESERNARDVLAAGSWWACWGCACW